MYAGTKKWGTVRIIIKRCKNAPSIKALILYQKYNYFVIVFAEQYKYKQTKRDDQEKYEKDLCADRKHEFDIIVRAANPKRKVSTLVSIIFFFWI